MAGVINKIRSQAGIVVGVIGLAMLAFIAQDAYQGLSGTMGDDPRRLAELNGQTVDSQLFESRWKYTQAVYQQVFGQTSYPEAQIQSAEWYNLQRIYLMGEQLMKLGLIEEKDLLSYIQLNEYSSQGRELQEPHALKAMVPSPELKELVEGEFPASDLLGRYFGSPQDYRQSEESAINILNSTDENVRNNQEAQNFVLRFLFARNSLRLDRLQQKLGNYIKMGHFVSKPEAKHRYIEENSYANGQVLVVNYGTLSDSLALKQVTEDDYESFYAAHKEEFRLKEPTAVVEYVPLYLLPTRRDSQLVRQTMRKLAADFARETNDSAFAAAKSNFRIEQPPLFDFRFQALEQVDGAYQDSLAKAQPGQVLGPLEVAGRSLLVKLNATTTTDSLQRVQASHILIPFGQDSAASRARAQSLVDSLKKGGDFGLLARLNSADQGSSNQGGSLGWLVRESFGDKFYRGALAAPLNTPTVVEGNAGWHIVKVDKRSTKAYRYSVLAQDYLPSQTTLDSLDQVASRMMAGLTEGQSLEALATKYKAGPVITTNPPITPQTRQIPGLQGDGVKTLVQWALESEANAVPDNPFETDNALVVARLKSIVRDDYSPLEAVREQIKPRVLNRVKARIIAEKLNATKANSLQAMAQAYGAGAFVTPYSNLSLASDMLPGLGREPRLVGAIFRAGKGKRTAPLAGDAGVYVAQVDDLQEAKFTDQELADYRKRLQQFKRQQVEGFWFQALMDAAKTTDLRYRFGM